jgi:hypothetical protein
MAGDWMKVELDTPDKPEVIGIAARLRIDQDAVTGKLFRIWAWADRNSMNGERVLLTPAFIDRLTSKRGFAAAMEAVGWLVVEDEFLTFPGFSRHNGTTAKERATTNRRVTKFRECNAPTVTDACQKPLPEKRREEKSKNTPQPPCRGGEGVGDEDLILQIKSLRKEWGALPALSAREARVFAKNRGLFGMFPADAWEVIREFLAARLPDGAAVFQPILLVKFLENPGGVLGQAKAWKEKQRPRFEVVKAPPGPATAEDAAALAEFLKKPEPKRMNS